MISISQTMRSQLSTPWTHTQSGIVRAIKTANKLRPIASAFAVSLFSLVSMNRGYMELLCRQCRKATADKAMALSAITPSTRASAGAREVTKGMSALPSSTVEVMP